MTLAPEERQQLITHYEVNDLFAKMQANLREIEKLL